MKVYWIFIFLTLNTYCATAQSNTDESSSANSQPFEKRIQGDIGAAVYSQNAVTQGNSANIQLLPYAYFDYARFFARIDNFGFKTLPLGWGYVEIVGKYNPEGFTPKGGSYSQLHTRNNPLLMGLGTFQLTPVGAFFINGYEDVNASKGKMAEFTYALEINWLDPVKIYPMLGFDYKDKQYLNYFYGVSPPESQSSGVSLYAPADAVSPYAQAVFEVPLSDHWIFNAFFKQKWLAPSIYHSPLVTQHRLDNVFIGVNYRFQ